MILGAIRFPSLFAAGEAGLDLAYRMGQVAAEEGRALGFNWTLGPCVDPLINPDTPTVGYRSAGRSIDRVIEIGNAYIKGTQDFGMMSTAKHFPGDGICIYDQHLTTPENPLPIEEWRSI